MNAGTPLAMASTPVSATDPPANALSSSRIADDLRSEGHGVLGTAGPASCVPVTIWNTADGDDGQGQADEQVGRDGEDVPGLA